MRTLVLALLLIFAQLKTIEAGEVCVICEFVMNEIDSFLQGNKSEAAVTKALDEVCTLLPDTIRRECVEFVNMYSSVIIDLLVNKLANPDQVCRDAKVCSSKQATLVKILEKNDQAQYRKDEAGPFCVICEFAMKEIDNFLQGNRSEADVTKALDEVCTLLPDTIRRECVVFVNMYSSVIIDLLVNKLANPDQVCRAAKLCTSKQAALVKILEKNDQAQRKKYEAGPFCVICEFIMKELDNFLQGNRSEAAVTKALDEVCTLLPDTIRAECVGFVNMYSSVIIDLLVNKLANPDQVCRDAKLCSSKQNALVKILEKNNQAEPTKCVLCYIIGTDLKDYLKQNHTTEEVETFLESLCSRLPDTVSAQCKDIVDQYVPAVLDLLRENMDVDEICKKLGLCSIKMDIKPPVFSAAQMVSSNQNEETLFVKLQYSLKLLGIEKCTYGPAFWCASRNNALMCNVVEHCEKHGWI